LSVYERFEEWADESIVGEEEAAVVDAQEDTQKAKDATHGKLGVDGTPAAAAAAAASVEGGLQRPRAKSMLPRLPYRSTKPKPAAIQTRDKQTTERGVGETYRGATMAPADFNFDGFDELSDNEQALELIRQAVKKEYDAIEAQFGATSWQARLAARVCDDAIRRTFTRMEEEANVEEDSPPGGVSQELACVLKEQHLGREIQQLQHTRDKLTAKIAQWEAAIKEYPPVPHQGQQQDTAEQTTDDTQQKPGGGGVSTDSGGGGAGAGAADAAPVEPQHDASIALLSKVEEGQRRLSQIDRWLSNTVQPIQEDFIRHLVASSSQYAPPRPIQDTPRAMRLVGRLANAMQEEMSRRPSARQSLTGGGSPGGRSSGAPTVSVPQPRPDTRLPRGPPTDSGNASEREGDGTKG